MTRPHVLIAGASIAGPALAMWLGRRGWDVTVVEQAPSFRTGGQNIDVRGAAREVLRRAGLEDAVRAATTGEVGTRFLGEGGRVVAEFPAERSATIGPTAELEVLRGDLARILLDAGDGSTTYRYGDRATALTDTGDDVRVSFAHGPDQRFDLVVAADGMRSTTRRLAFGDEAVVRPLGMEMSYLTIPRTDTDTDWWNWYSEPGGLAVHLRPDRHGTTRALLTAVTSGAGGGAGESAADGGGRRSREDQEDRLRRQFRDVGWEAPRVLAALGGAEDLYSESIGQVRAPRWTNGRVALLGDAAWCASPVSGMGTSLSLVGAYVLAGELTAHADHREAFARYEEVMRPYVAQAQHLPPGVPHLANPRSRAGLAAFRLGLRVAATPALGRLGGRLFSPPADAVDLPDHGRLEQAG